MRDQEARVCCPQLFYLELLVWHPCDAYKNNPLMGNPPTPFGGIAADATRARPAPLFYGTGSQDSRYLLLKKGRDSDSLLTAGTWGWLNKRWNDMGVGSVSAIYRANMFTQPPREALAETARMDFKGSSLSYRIDAAYCKY